MFHDEASHASRCGNHRERATAGLRGAARPTRLRVLDDPGRHGAAGTGGEGSSAYLEVQGVRTASLPGSGNRAARTGGSPRHHHAQSRLRHDAAVHDEHAVCGLLHLPARRDLRAAYPHPGRKPADAARRPGRLHHRGRRESLSGTGRSGADAQQHLARPWQ